MFGDIIVQYEEDGELFNWAPIDEQDGREPELLSLLIQHLVKGTSRITLRSGLFNPWPMATYWVCWLWLRKVRVLLDVEGLNFPIPPVVDHSKWDRSKKEESPSYHSIKANRIESGQKIGFRHLSNQMSVGTIGRAP